MQDLLQKGYAEPVAESQVDAFSGWTWYIPHHNVHNPNKLNKTRIVFDCAAEHDGASLNKRVLSGPDLANSLLGVLLRFHQGRVAIMSDVEVMFHQVFVK